MKQKNNILKIEVIITILTLILGILLHFTFEWSNNNLIIGCFSSVNESTWEHLKLIFFPMLLSTVIVSFISKKENYICSKTKGILIALSFVIIFFYTYTGIIGNNITFLDISSFFIAIILGEFYSYQKIKNNNSCNNLIAIIILLVLTLCFILFTFFPPHIGLFKDPVNNMFGII